MKNQIPLFSLGVLAFFLGGLPTGDKFSGVDSAKIDNSVCRPMLIITSSDAQPQFTDCTACISCTVYTNSNGCSVNAHCSANYDCTYSE